MKASDFIDILTKKYIVFKIDTTNYIITVLGKSIFLNSLESLPENVHFNNRGNINLDSLKSLPKNIKFNNDGDVYLESLTSLLENTRFNNGRNVYLKSLKLLPKNVQFNNGGYVYLSSLTSLPKSTQFNNGRSVYLYSLESTPENFQFNNGGAIILKNNILKSKEPVSPAGKPKRKNEVENLYKILLKFFEYNYPVYSGSSITCLECKSEYWLSGKEFKADIDNGLRKVFIHKSTCMTHDKLMKELN